MPPDSLDVAVRALLARFRRQRPLRSGSLLITILGDAIAPRGGAVTLNSLIKLAKPFGLTERLVRTSVGRLAHDGWLESRRAGRQSEYALASHGQARFAEATQRIYGEPTQEWHRDWTIILLPPDLPAARRERTRTEMLWLGFGQVGAGVLAHPSLSLKDVLGHLSRIGSRDGVVVLKAASAGAEHDLKLVAAGWNLAELARSYRRFVTSFASIGEALSAARPIAPEEAFVIRTLLIHEYRKIHLRDPLLPNALLPANWIGTGAYELCRSLYMRVFVEAEAHISANALRLDGPLAPPSRAIRRFGMQLPEGRAR